MSLASIVSSVVKKEPKVDRKKVAYFLRDFNPAKNQTYSVRILLSLLKPENVVIVDAQTDFSCENPGNNLEYLQKTIAAILPDAKVDTVRASLSDKSRSLVLDEKSPLTEEDVSLAELGFFISTSGYLQVYKGTHIPEDVKFHVEEPTKESMDHYLQQDINVLLPTEGMFLVNELTRNRDAEIMICHFPELHKRDVIKQITSITAAVLNSSIRAKIEVAYYSEDFTEWGDDKDTVSFMGHQYDYVLALRGDRIDVHLPFENGHLPKEPNGWLLLN